MDEHYHVLLVSGDASITQEPLFKPLMIGMYSTVIRLSYVKMMGIDETPDVAICVGTQLQDAPMLDLIAWYQEQIPSLPVVIILDEGDDPAPFEAAPNVRAVLVRPLEPLALAQAVGLAAGS